MRGHEIEQSQIHVWRDALSPSDCKGIIDLFEACPDEHYAGTHGAGDEEQVDSDGRTNLRISDSENPLWSDFDKTLFISLGRSLQDMVGKYVPIAMMPPFEDTGYQIQRYAEGQHYKWHVDNSHPATSQRFLAALWYLNDDFEEGETEFQFQDVKIAPERGTLVLFPPFWTHLHRALPPVGGAKYVITSWVVYTPLD